MQNAGRNLMNTNPVSRTRFCGPSASPAWFPARLLVGLVVGALSLGSFDALQAQPFISGNIQFNGGATLDTGNLATATAFTSIFGPNNSLNPVVLPGGETGSYALIPGNTPATFNTFTFEGVSATPTPFSSGPSTNSSTSYSFYATSVTVVYQSSFFLDIQGTGIADIDGFSPTAGLWQVTDSGAGGVPVFSFGAATEASGGPAPEPTTVALLFFSLPLVWLALRARRSAPTPQHATTTK